MNISDVSDDNFDNKVLQSDKTVVVWFYSGMPDQQLQTILSTYSRVYGSKMDFFKINQNHNQDSSRRYDVGPKSTVLIFEDGAEVRRIRDANMSEVSRVIPSYGM